MGTMHAWVPTTDLMELRRLGKSCEELGELIAVLGRCICQGIREVDPSTGKTNLLRLEEETADVRAQLAENIAKLGMDELSINARTLRKRGLMQEWEALFEKPATGEPS